MKLRNFFTKWFYISALLILVGILLFESKPSDEQLSFIAEIIAKTLESIGIAIFVANIFSFTLGTEEFLNYIRDHLVKVVVSKEFLTKLNPEEQRSMLKMVLKPSKELSEIYSSITDYFNQYIEDSMRLFKKCYRGHMIVDAVATFNREKNIVQIEYDIDCDVYKISNEFDPIVLTFEDESFVHVRTVIRGQGTEPVEINKETIKNMESLEDPSMVKGQAIPIPESFNHLNQINTTMRVIEYGNDHWQIFSFKTVKPCDHLTIILRCEDDLTIKNTNTYGVQKKFAIERSDKKIKVTFNDWLSPGFGVNIVVSKNNHHALPN